MISEEESKKFIEYADLEDLEGIKKIINKDNVNELLTEKRLIDSKCKYITYTYLPLNYMLDTEKIEILEYLLSIGANPNTNSILDSAIADAIEETSNTGVIPNMEKIQLLVKYGANINYISYMFDRHYTPLNKAIASSHYEAEDYLRSLGAKTYLELVGEITIDENYLLFRKHCYNLDLESLKKMGDISEYINIPYQNNTFKSALVSLVRDVERYEHKKLTKERLDVFEYLLKNGANPNITEDNRLLSQLIVPLFMKNEETKLNTKKAFKLYVDYGGDINAKSNKEEKYYDMKKSDFVYYDYTVLDKILMHHRETENEVKYLRKLGVKTAKEL